MNDGMSDTDILSSNARIFERINSALNRAGIVVETTYEAAIEELASQRDAAAAIVGKLPKFADTGEPIICPCDAWIRPLTFGWLSDNGNLDKVCKVKLWHHTDHWCLTESDLDDCDWGEGPVYSTEAAAIAAVTEEGI